MDKTEITQKRHELRKNILSVYQLEKELTQEFLANHPNIVGTVLKYKSGNATTYKKNHRPPVLRQLSAHSDTAMRH